jgi:3-isopropylmalate/(R)-2-methylmalate dehydratase small subunit
MERFTQLEAVACPLGLANVDTDQLIPARFMKRSRADGYGAFLLHDLRFNQDGQVQGSFPLNNPRFAGAHILVARRNFGTGSSREAAVYALWDFGIRCVIAPGFGDIFASNAVKNGLLPATVTEAEAEKLLDQLEGSKAPVIRVDLETKKIAAGDLTIDFIIDAAQQVQLLNGWDDIDMTMRHREEIIRFKAYLLARTPWALPRANCGNTQKRDQLLAELPEQRR